MKSIVGLSCLLLAAIVATLTAVAHLSCIPLGPACYEAQLAPHIIVESAIDGTLLAPIATLLVSLLFLLCSAYALSRAGLIRRLPLTNLAMVTLAVLCIIRGLLAFQLKIRHPELVNSTELVSSVIWFISGLLFWFGHVFFPRVSAQPSP